MTSKLGSERAVTLALERLTETAIIGGEVVDLPPREFALLSDLAARPGTAVHTKKLVAAVWPDTPGMTPQDLYVVISTLRKRIRDAERENQLIRTQRRFGYYLALPPEQVLIADELDEAYNPQVIRIDPDENSQQPEDEVGAPLAAPLPDAVATSRTESSASRGHMLRPLVAAAFILMAIAGSWSAGYVISSKGGVTEHPTATPHEEPSAASGDEVSRRPRSRGQHKDPRKEDGRDKIKKAPRRQRQSAPIAVAAGPVVSAPQAPSGESGSTARTNTEPAQKQPRERPKSQPAPLPPAPTRFLYHLVNRESGDHFVTTDGNVFSQYQARGYEGGAIGRIYTSPVEGTRAVSTNQGTAYIFIRSDTKTEPATRAVPLWYATNNSGDFFYTTNEGEAKQAGWSASVVGYVGAL